MEWISVEEGLPDLEPGKRHSPDCLCFDGYDKFIGRFRHRVGFVSSDDNFGGGVTHWVLLPESPKGE